MDEEIIENTHIKLVYCKNNSSGNSWEQFDYFNGFMDDNSEQSDNDKDLQSWR